MAKRLILSLAFNHLTDIPKVAGVWGSSMGTQEGRHAEDVIGIALTVSVKIHLVSFN